MPLEVTLILQGGWQRQEPGQLFVEGTRFRFGYLSVRLANLRVDAIIQPDGGVRSVRSTSDGYPGLSSTLVRISR
jgi:hypothetical protein